MSEEQKDPNLEEDSEEQRALHFLKNRLTAVRLGEQLLDRCTDPVKRANLLARLEIARKEYFDALADFRAEFPGLMGEEDL